MFAFFSGLIKGFIEEILHQIIGTEKSAKK